MEQEAGPDAEQRVEQAGPSQLPSAPPPYRGPGQGEGEQQMEDVGADRRAPGGDG